MGYLIHLNTSYVKVKLLKFGKLITESSYLNTSYVKVKPNATANKTFATIFKYILC